MIWAILADVHGRVRCLDRVLADATARGARQVLSLGDVGSAVALYRLMAAKALPVFGNWEASGFRDLARPLYQEVRKWPAQYRDTSFWAAHASPLWPQDLTIEGVIPYLRERQLHWMSLFPSLYHSEADRWRVFAELEYAGVPLFFHGHTHVQAAWEWRAGQAPRAVSGPILSFPADGTHLIIGVGSVGDPRDGDGACYALFDDDRQVVTWRRV